MTSSQQPSVKPWVASQILSFLNQAETTDDLVGPASPISDEPDKEETSGYGIGETVAQRILDARNSLMPRYFQDLSQLEEIPGFGEDKFKDLLYSFRLPAAERFHQQMTQGLLGSNWKLSYFAKQYDDEEEFLYVTSNESGLKQEIGELLMQWNEELGKAEEVGALLPGLVAGTYPDHYDVAEYARYAWALWFYQFDADNWFSFDQVKEAVDKYLNTYWNIEDRIELILFRGFDNAAWVRGGITTEDLPVTLNFAERTITAWTCELFD